MVSTRAKVVLRAAGIALSAAGLLSLGACRSGGKSARGPRDPALKAGEARKADGPDISASERSVANGLELVWWVVDDQDAVLGQALASRADAAGAIDADAVKRWRDAGLRIVPVPLTEMSAVTADLPIIGRVQREWMGQLPRWTVAVRGSTTEAITIGMADGPLTLGPGRLRMLVRCWLNPVPDEQMVGASLRVELLPQHEERADDAKLYQSALGINVKPGIESEGLVFARLALGIDAKEGWAYLIVPETPEAQWRAGRPEATGQETLPHAQPPAAPERAALPPGPWDDAMAAAPASDAGEQGPNPLSQDGDRGARREVSFKPRPMGPSPFKLRTLGEVMLTDAPGGGQARAKVVLALIPRVPVSYRLLSEGQ